MVGAGDIGEHGRPVLAPFEVDLTLVGRTRPRRRPRRRRAARAAAARRRRGADRAARPTRPAAWSTPRSSPRCPTARCWSTPRAARSSTPTRCVAELTAGRLRAALDVTDPEPLPAGHPLWSAPGLLLTPHVGGQRAGCTRRAGGGPAWPPAAARVLRRGAPGRRRRGSLTVCGLRSSCDRPDPAGPTAAARRADIKPRSRDVTDGLEQRPPARMLRAVGMGDDDWGKPQVGVASSLERGHALQPAARPAGQAGQGGRARRRRLPARVRHDRGVRRHLDGPRGHARLAGLAARSSPTRSRPSCTPSASTARCCSPAATSRCPAC